MTPNRLTNAIDLIEAEKELNDAISDAVREFYTTDQDLNHQDAVSLLASNSKASLQRIGNYVANGQYLNFDVKLFDQNDAVRQERADADSLRAYAADIRQQVQETLP